MERAPWSVLRNLWRVVVKRVMAVPREACPVIVVRVLLHQILGHTLGGTVGGTVCSCFRGTLFETHCLGALRGSVRIHSGVFCFPCLHQIVESEHGMGLSTSEGDKYFRSLLLWMPMSIVCLVLTYSQAIYYHDRCTCASHSGQVLSTTCSKRLFGLRCDMAGFA